MEETNKLEAPEMVDLGLPSGLKWAKWNVGATKETEYGKLFAWGDIVGSEATKDGCKGKFTKSWYNKMELSTITSDITSGQDAASMEYGENYRMPTNEEMEELIANTKHSVEIINNIKGSKFTATNGNYIFFPFAGYGNNGSLYIQGNEALIWSFSYISNGSAWGLYGYGEGYGVDIFSRYYGFSVRAVCA